MRSAAPAEALPILVVDDDSALIRTLADILRMHGYAPSTAETGEEGLAIAEHQKPMLAVVDLRLPDMDGMELASRLHALSEMTEVVVLTGNASIDSAIAAMREHSVDYLVKPVNVEHLLQVASVATERWQRRRAEERLRESDERFRRVVESDMLGIMFWDSTGKVEDANNAFLEMTGYSHAELAASFVNWRRMTPAKYQEIDEAKLQEIARAGVIEPYEKELIRKDGTAVCVLVGASTLTGSKDRGVAFVLNISDRKSAEQALEARARQQAAVANLGRRALVVTDVATLFSDAVVLVSETLELPFASVSERRTDGSLVLKAAVGWPESQIGKALVPQSDNTATGWAFNHNEAAIITDLQREERFTGSRILLEQGVKSGVIVVIPGAATPYGVLGAHDTRPREFSRDDVHFLDAIAHILGTAVERNRSDRAFRQAQRLEAVGRLASGVAHDFNNMLTAITGYGEMVKATLADDDSRKGDVDEILKSANRAAGLTRQLLAFSRQQVLQPRMLMLNEIVSGMGKMLERLIGPDVRVITSLDPDLGLIKADPGQLEQVILNLCVNARDAMPDGGMLTVETKNVELDRRETAELSMEAPGSYVMLAVSDNGTGMDPETKARIFEPFFTTKPADQGTGLGLATVYGIVKQSGGEIWVYSELGRGTTFKIFLPRIPEEAAPDHLENGARKQPAVPGSETILFAEDEAAIQRVGKRILERAGYTVLSAANGEEALKIARAHRGRIDMLVTDMMMPNMNGIQLAERLREVRPGMPTLFLSGYTDSTVVRQGPLNPSEHFLQKPFATEALVGKVREVLDSPRHHG